ncbi:MAG TPA: methyl-accepting chemotaxis protein, partial [Anaeromyxobacteraceae bacterium]|nr:methyl-accepting chemotaxis protein [Anaeromyxobacteraceae bacterium]
AIHEIEKSAGETVKIIKIIDEIAFQTNLLALNAAVEAARAGEAGRGFAVVAEEVRALAMRSKEAASKTEELIRRSVREAGEGEGTAAQVSAKLAEIAASVTKVSDIVAEIAASAREQAAGIEQVNRAVEQMDRVTQANAAGSEESSSAAAELSGQSEELAAMVGSFKLEISSARPAKLALPKKARPAAQAPRLSSAPGQGASTIPIGPEEIGSFCNDASLNRF